MVPEKKVNNQLTGYCFRHHLIKRRNKKKGWGWDKKKSKNKKRP